MHFNVSPFEVLFVVSWSNLNIHTPINCTSGLRPNVTLAPSCSRQPMNPRTPIDSLEFFRNSFVAILSIMSHALTHRHTRFCLLGLLLQPRKLGRDDKPNCNTLRRMKLSWKTLVSAPVPIGIGIRGLGLGLDNKTETLQHDVSKTGRGGSDFISHIYICRCSNVNLYPSCLLRGSRIVVLII